MLITLISECEKKALLRTRRVLDAFAISCRAGSLEIQKPKISSRIRRFTRREAIRYFTKFA